MGRCFNHDDSILNDENDQKSFSVCLSVLRKQWMIALIADVNQAAGLSTSILKKTGHHLTFLES